MLTQRRCPSTKLWGAVVFDMLGFRNTGVQKVSSIQKMLFPDVHFKIFGEQKMDNNIFKTMSVGSSIRIRINIAMKDPHFNLEI